MKNLSFHVVFMQYLEIISEHNQIDKKNTQQRNWKSYIRIFGAYTIIQLSKTSKKNRTRQRLTGKTVFGFTSC